jgi:hypothetical protein
MKYTASTALVSTLQRLGKRPTSYGLWRAPILHLNNYIGYLFNFAEPNVWPAELKQRIDF